jgi:hypothetical protein
MLVISRRKSVAWQHGYPTIEGAQSSRRWHIMTKIVHLNHVTQMSDARSRYLKDAPSKKGLPVHKRSYYYASSGELGALAGIFANARPSQVSCSDGGKK